MNDYVAISSRPPVAAKRLSLSRHGKVIYTLKTPYRDDTAQFVFDRGGHPPLDFIARLAALALRGPAKPRVNLTRYHGVHAPNHRWRGIITPAKRGHGAKRKKAADQKTPAEHHTAMTWAQRLKRVFNIDTEARFHKLLHNTSSQPSQRYLRHLPKTCFVLPILAHRISYQRFRILDTFFSNQWFSGGSNTINN